MNFVLLTILLSLATFVPRVVPALFINKMKFSGRAKLYLQLLPYTVMSALVFPGILSTDPDSISIGLAGGAAAIFCSWLKLPVIVSILAAVGCDLCLYLIR